MGERKKIWTAALVVIGDKILSGRTHDKNIAQVASWLQIQGIRLAEVRVVPDEQDAIVEAVNALRLRSDYLFTTGGIGPRAHDDITVDRCLQRGGRRRSSTPKRAPFWEVYLTTRAAASMMRGLRWRASLRPPRVS